MKLTEFIERYGDLYVDEQHLKEALNIKDRVWMPKTGERYYYLSESGTSHTDIYSDSCNYSESVIKYSRIFQTEEETKFEAKRQRFRRFMEREFAKGSGLIDWEDKNQEKWYFEYDWEAKTLSTTFTYVHQGQEELYTTSRRWLEEFIRQNEDDIKRYCFGVEK